MHRLVEAGLTGAKERVRVGDHHLRRIVVRVICCVVLLALLLLFLLSLTQCTHRASVDEVGINGGVWTLILLHLDGTWVGLDHSLSIFTATHAANYKVDCDTENRENNH